ncbi:MAG: phage tail tape measure protein, partial [Bacilli bacterium]
TGADDSGVALADLFSSIEAKGAVMTLTGEAGAEAFATALDEMGASSGATEKAFGTMDESASRSIDKLMAMFEEFKLQIGDVFLPVLKDQILPVLTNLLTMFGDLPDWVKPVILVIGGLGAALVVIGPLLIALPGLITAIGAAFAILSANPIILVIGGLILLLIWLQSEFDILGIAIDALQKGMEIASEFFSAAIEVMGDVAEFVIGAIVGYFSNLWNNINTIIGYITTAFNVFMGVVETVGDFISGVFDTVVGTVKGAINWIIDGINTMIRGLNMLSFDVPDWIPGIGGASFGFNLNTIPRLAEGGIVTEPTIAMIGEAGPEAVVPLSEGGAGGINITVENMNVRDDKDIKLIADELYTLIDRKNRARGVV